MKNIKKLLLCALMTAGMASCDYLDIAPDNMATIEYAFTDRENALRYLYTCYDYRPKIGNLDADPAMSGEETWQYISMMKADVFREFYPFQIARGDQSVVNPLLNYWDGLNSRNNVVMGLWKGIRDINVFLENIPNVRVDMIETERKRWIAEAKFLKAYYHFYLMQMYGPVPIVDKNMPISASVLDVKVYREPIDEVVDYIVGLLEEAYSDLPEPKNLLEGTEAGRADKLIALSLIVQTRIWAASPLVNGNNIYVGMVDKRKKALFPQEKKVEKWALAVEACERAITLAQTQGKELHKVVESHVTTSDEVFQLQSVLRTAVLDRWNNELIWGGNNYEAWTLFNYATPRFLRRDFTVLNDINSMWCPTLKSVEKFYSSNGVPIEEDLDWLNNGWYSDRYKIRPEPATSDEKFYVREGQQTAYLHYNREPRFYADIAFDKGIYYGNGWYDQNNLQYTDFFNLGHSGFQGGSSYSISGYAAKKMSGFTNEVQNKAQSYTFYPFPIFRLADLYLLYAEALNEANDNQQVRDKAITYLDLIRERANLKGVKESWAAHSRTPDKPNSQAGLRDIIHRERTIELMFEGKHHWDIRRWNKITELNDQPQGWTCRGETADDFYKITNIYDKTVTFTQKDYFAPIRESNLYVNDNLIQNYGW